MSSLLKQTVDQVRDECQRQMAMSSLPESILDSISDTETGNLFKGHPLTLTALPLLVYEAVGAGQPADVAPAGAAMEFLLAAGDVLDDLQDGAPRLTDLTGEGAVLFAARQAELVVALLLLSEQAMLSFDGSRVSAARAAEAARLFCDMKLKAFSGQVEDTENTVEAGGGPVQSLEIVQKKSGSVGRGAGAIGAVLGTGDAAVIQLAAEFGERLGIICQLNNDIADLWPSSGKLEDLVAGKVTLPVAYANAVTKPAPGAAASETHSVSAVRDRIFEAGGIHFTLVHVGVQLVKARGIARRFKGINPGSRLDELLEIR